VLTFTPWHTAGGLFSSGGLECLAASVSYAISYIYMARRQPAHGTPNDEQTGSDQEDSRLTCCVKRSFEQRFGRPMGVGR
jgi:hypothetical protein